MPFFSNTTFKFTLSFAAALLVSTAASAQSKKTQRDDFLAPEACLAGKVFVDCNNNTLQDNQELGIPSVRLYMEDGTYFLTDSEGKYSYCGLSPKSHVVTVDMVTMPRSARLSTTANRNLGDANSIMLDTKAGQLARADFAETTCSKSVMAEVKNRRTAKSSMAPPEATSAKPALKWESKAR
jgi:large repetitive protein